MNVRVVIKRCPRVVKLMIELYHGNLKVIEFMIEYYHRSPGMVKLVLRPYYIDSHIYVSH